MLKWDFKTQTSGDYANGKFNLKLNSLKLQFNILKAHCEKQWALDYEKDKAFSFGMKGGSEDNRVNNTNLY